MDKFFTPEFHEQRASTRYPVALFVELENGSGWTRDVSTTGACIETDQVFDRGVGIHFYLNLPDELGSLTKTQCSGVVVRLEPTAEGWRVGVLIEEIKFE